MTICFLAGSTRYLMWPPRTRSLTPVAAANSLNFGSESSPETRAPLNSMSANWGSFWFFQSRSRTCSSSTVMVRFLPPVAFAGGSMVRPLMIRPLPSGVTVL